jgi:VIT1/CCC1 family predicted Fe2+/Mn2+ transporter
MKNLKLADVILLSLSTAFLFISIYEMYHYGLNAAYWSIMFTIIFFFWYGYRKGR